MRVGKMYDVKYSWTGMTSAQTDSLRLVLWAQTLGLNEEFMAALGWRHYGHGARLADHKVLLEAAEEAGLDRAEAKAVLNSRRYGKELMDVSMEYSKKTMLPGPGGEENAQMGAIPMFLFSVAGYPALREERLQGSHPQQAFEDILERLEYAVM